MRGLNICVVLAATVVLMGCATAPVAIETADRSPEPTAAASAAPVSEPASRLGLACDDVLPAGLVASVLNRTTVTTDLMVRPQSTTPLGYAVSQVGGVSCLASGDATA